MNLLKPVSYMTVTVIDASSAAQACVSDSVLDGTNRGRHGIRIYAKTKIYIGDKDVTTSTGMPINAGESISFPVSETVKIPCYAVGGEAILTEVF